MYRTYDFRCNTCGHIETRLVDSNYFTTEFCSCGLTMERIFSPPNIRTEKTSASYIDGQRKRTKEFQELSRQGQLEDVLFDSESEAEKEEAKKELRKLGAKDV